MVFSLLDTLLSGTLAADGLVCTVVYIGNTNQKAKIDLHRPFFVLF